MSYDEGFTGRGGICEDAPCCGCCGTSLYGSSGWQDDEPYERDDYYDEGPDHYDEEEALGVAAAEEDPDEPLDLYMGTFEPTGDMMADFH